MLAGERSAIMNKKMLYILAAIIAAAALYAISLYNYPLFHSIVEMFSIVIAASIFVIAWNTRNFSPNPYLLFIGISYLYVASLDLIHTLGYKGMGVFAGSGANLSTQLWICGRYMQGISLLVAPYFIGRKLKIIPVFILYFLVSAGLLLSIYYGLFPETFIEGKGLTMFKIISEYVISLILVLAIIYLRKKRGTFDEPVLNLLIWSMLATIASEMAFTLYTDVYGFFNTLGHYFKIASYYLIYAAIIKMNLRKPYESIVESEEKFRAITTSAKDAIIMIGNEGEVVFWNNAAEKISGYSAGETMGKELHTFFAPERYRAAFREGFRRFRETGAGPAVGKTLELSALRKDGTEIPVELSLAAVNMKGRWNAIGMVRDITERKKAEEALLLQVRIDNIFLTIPDDEMYNEVLKVVLEEMHSEYGVFGYIDEEGALVVPSMTRHIWDKCHVPDKTFRFPRDIWGHSSWVRAIREKTPNYTNEVSTLTPVGHIKILRHISFPVVFQGEVIGLFQVANKKTDYTETDIRQLGTIANRIVSTLNARLLKERAEKELRKSEERFRNLVETTSDWVWEVDKSGIYTYASPAVSYLLGYGPEEVLGKTPFDLMPPEEAKRVAEIFGSLVAERKPLTYLENINLHKDGRQVILETCGVPFFDPDGIFIGYRGVDRDVTERKKSEAFIKNILESVGEGFIVIGPDYRIITANMAFCEQSKMPLEDIINRHCYEISHNIDKPCFEAGERCASRHTFETGESCTELHTHYDKEGTPVYVEVKAYPMKDQGGSVISVIEIANDITQKKKLEDQLRQAQKMEAVGQLAGGIAHDFNNIISAIIGYGYVTLMKMAKDDPLRFNIEQMLAASDRAAELTKSILAFSRKQILDKKPVDLNELILKVEKLLNRLIGEDISINLTLSKSEINILADSGQIEQVLMNLATNARDAMPKGGLLSIETSMRELDNGFIKNHGYGNEGKFAVMTVSDSGMGMDEETRKRIFEPFFTTKEVGKGTGLGLAMVYGIIKQHDGYINVYSEPEKGTTFRIYLPVIGSAVSEEKKAPEAELQERGGETILFAEDDKQLREFNASLLQDFGYTVIVANDGEDAVKKLMENKDKVQLLLFDLVMPKKSGKEAYDEIRQINPDVRIIFMSGYAPDIILQKGLIEDGMTLISKPISPKDLLKKVRNVLNGVKN